MKKILYITFALFCTVFFQELDAQNTYTLRPDHELQHLTFKNVPITGTEDVFEKRLKDNGLERGKNGMFRGSFAGQEILATVLCTPVSQTVYSVAVLLPSSANWTSIYELYRTFRTKLTEVYGEPVSLNEKFIHPFFNGDGFEAKAFRENRAKFDCRWETPKGQIIISIELTTDNKFIPLLTYTDGQGLELFEKENDSIYKSDL